MLGMAEGRLQRKQCGKPTETISSWLRFDDRNLSRFAIACLPDLVASNVMIQVRSQSFFDCRQGLATPGGIIFDLVAPNPSYPEIFCLGVRKIKAAYAGSGFHREGFGQAHAGVLLCIEQPEQRLLFSVIRAGRVTRSGPDAAIFFADQVGLG